MTLTDVRQGRVHDLELKQGIFSFFVVHVYF